MSFTKNIIAYTVIKFIFVTIYCLFLTNTSNAATFCVANATELLNVLAEATSNGQNDRIQIQQGTYNGSFIYDSTEPYGVTIAGGYTASCALRVVDANNTVLDAQNNGRVLTVNSPSVAADFVVVGLTIQNGNVAGNFGGGLYISTGTGKIALTDNRISNNTTNTSGGGSYIVGNGASVTLTSNMITHNTAVDAGGAFISGGGPDGSVFLDGNLISDNIASDSNGGLSVSGEKEINLVNNHVKDNITSGGGGAISVRSCQKSIITNNVINDNSANGAGAGLFINIDSGYQNALINIINNTIIKNSSVGMGGGLYLSLENDNQIANIYNNILLNNNASEGADLYIRNDDNGDEVASIINLFYNDFDQSSDGAYIQLPFPIDPSNLNNEDPLFHVNYIVGDIVEPVVTHHLRPDSPCIDAGTSQNAPPDDIDRDPRPWGAGVDIGADEHIPPEEYWTPERMRNADPIGAPTIEIMPLGDSITAGSTGSFDDSGYRRPLYLSLTAAGYDVDFVGSQIDGIPNDFDQDHEGHSGFRDDQIADMVYDWLTANPADIVLLHIGTNAVDESTVDLERILDEIDGFETDNAATVWVILALIINRNCITAIPSCPESVTTMNFNNNVLAMAQDRIDFFGDKILIVDMENGTIIDYHLSTDNPPGDMWDNLHPFETGYEKMADLWLDALVQTLPDPNPAEYPMKVQTTSLFPLSEPVITNSPVAGTFGLPDQAHNKILSDNSLSSHPPVLGKLSPLAGLATAGDPPGGFPSGGQSNNTPKIEFRGAKEVDMQYTDMAKVKGPKRPNDWSAEEKLKVILEAASLDDEQLGSFLRKKGLHQMHLEQWLLQMLDGFQNGLSKKYARKKKADAKHIRALEKEINRKDKALAETATLLVLKKKVKEIWGDEDEPTAGCN